MHVLWCLTGLIFQRMKVTPKLTLPDLQKIKLNLKTNIRIHWNSLAWTLKLNQRHRQIELSSSIQLHHISIKFHLHLRTQRKTSTYLAYALYIISKSTSHLSPCLWSNPLHFSHTEIWHILFRMIYFTLIPKVSTLF